MPDKYTAVWVSHSSISDFLECPRAYFLKNVYRDPKTNHKIKLISPPLALGSAVHEVLESLSILPKEKRFSESLMVKFERAWEKVKGKRGGFFDIDTEYREQERGRAMIRRVTDSPGPLSGLAVKIKQDLPSFWLSEEDNIILCGKIDWLEYLPEIDSVHIIDFKTGRNEEKKESLQLPIYYLLAKNCQEYKIVKASYWYLETSDELSEKILPNEEEAVAKVLKVARQIKLARQLNKMTCNQKSGGCPACRPWEAILRGEGELVGIDNYGANVYALPRPQNFQRDSKIL
ncbi:MAG: PD-(D/E)XK nuclease family protein [Patescibacteria group bacterium]|nr:PD-(D/E)XK nuclease family protein [Patescibacteria group bacterium]